MLTSFEVFLIVISALSLIFTAALLAAQQLAKQQIKKLVKSIPNNIGSLQKGLIDGLKMGGNNERDRLSQFEINSIMGAVKKTVGDAVKKELEGQIKSNFSWLLFIFFVAGILSFSLIVILFYYFLA